MYIDILEEFQIFQNYCLKKSGLTQTDPEYQENIEQIKEYFSMLCFHIFLSLPDYQGIEQEVKCQERIYLYSHLTETPCKVLNEFAKACITVNQSILKNR